MSFINFFNKDNVEINKDRDGVTVYCDIIGTTDLLEENGGMETLLNRLDDTPSTINALKDVFNMAHSDENFATELNFCIDASFRIKNNNIEFGCDVLLSGVSAYLSDNEQTLRDSGYRRRDGGYFKTYWDVPLTCKEREYVASVYEHFQEKTNENVYVVKDAGGNDVSLPYGTALQIYEAIETKQRRNEVINQLEIAGEDYGFDSTKISDKTIDELVEAYRDNIWNLTYGSGESRWADALINVVANRIDDLWCEAKRNVQSVKQGKTVER